MSQRLDLVLIGATSTSQTQPVYDAAASAIPYIKPVAQGLGGHIAWVMANRPDWASLVSAARSDNPAVVVIDQPTTPTPADLADLGDGIVPLWLVTPHNWAPAVATMKQAAAGLEFDWLEAATFSPGEADPWTCLFDALVLLRSAGLGDAAIDNLTFGPHCVVAEARAGQTAVHLTCLRGSYPLKATVKAFGSFGSLELALGDPRAAFPGEVVRVGPDGSTLYPTTYQTPRRMALLEAHALVAGSRNPDHLLSAYAQTVANLAAAGYARTQ
ncbi:MAG: hypothetical protein LBJ62_06855 [Bifidobacteriaceae bacterium]|jgi:hypothetical protein|nr:hypothetical protein [Bifidobacteriaceae bacterium]